MAEILHTNVYQIHGDRYSISNGNITVAHISAASASLEMTDGRPRRQYGKARTGCQRCKARRLKCDESEPECKNCVKQCLECPGYTRALRWSRKHEHFVASESGSCNTERRCLQPPAAAKVNRSNANSSIESALLCGPVNTFPLVASEGLLTHGPIPQPPPHLTLPLAHYERDDLVNDAEESNRALQITSIEHSPPLVVCSLRHPDYGTSRDSPSSQRQPLYHRIYDNPTDLSTTLIEYWFGSMCPMWSTFDSEVNFNRRIALDHWTVSKPVFFALQAMSAAYLSNSLSSVRAVLHDLVEQANTAIEESMAAVVRGSGLLAIDLVFAVFALGTSSHWTGNFVLGESLLSHACSLLRTWKENEELTSINTFLYGYFRQALTYWQMLRCVNDYSTPSGSNNHEVLDQFISSHDAGDEHEEPPLSGSRRIAEGTRPNSWCGVSEEVVAIFGQIISLCRHTRTSHKRGDPTTGEAYRSSMQAKVEHAHDLQRLLMAMDFEAKVHLDEQLGFSLATLDAKTPVSHLIHVAEAYRQASLIQLLLTFGEFDPQLPRAVSAAAYYKHSCKINLDLPRVRPRSAKLTALTLDLVSTLNMIPTDSGSRCLQPILYISAAAGLRLAFTDSSIIALNTASGASRGPTQAMVKILEARNLILSRLVILHHTLPPRPISICIDLVKAIWTRYDSSAAPVHWIDVMIDTGLCTLFR